jgi:hypothetical protein
VTLAFDVILIYLSLYFPLGWLFTKADQPWKSPPNWLANTVDFGTIALILFLDFFLFYKYYEKPKTFYLAPLFTLLMIGGLTLRGITAEGAPNTTIDSTGNGHHYRTEVWIYGTDGTQKFKRWKTIDYYDGNANPYDLRYRVDSVWFGK